MMHGWTQLIRGAPSRLSVPSSATSASTSSSFAVTTRSGAAVSNSSQFTRGHRAGPSLACAGRGGACRYPGRALESGGPHSGFDVLGEDGCEMITSRAIGFHSAEALIALAMLVLGGLCPPLP